MQIQHRKGGVMLVVGSMEEGGIKALAAQVIRLASEEYLSDYRPRIPQVVIDQESGQDRPNLHVTEMHPCTGHRAICRCRACAEDFLFGHLHELPMPFNFVFCCDVLNLRPELVREGLRRRRQEVSAASVGVR